MILHIDDNVQIREIVRAFLSTHGYQVVQVEDGIKGLEMIHHLKPNLVLLDLDLPGLSGLEVIKQVKGDPELSQIRIIAFTGSAIPDDRPELLAAGFADLLLKPAAILDLLNIVEFHYPAGSSL